MTKTLLLLCLILLAGTCGLIYALGQLSADLQRTTIALDAMVGRVASAEDDLASIADDVYSIADDVNAIADSLADDEDDDEANEEIGWRRAAEHRGRAEIGVARPRGASRTHRHAASARRAGRAHRIQPAAAPVPATR